MNERLSLSNPTKPLLHPARQRLEELDGLRGLMALLVVVYHLQAVLPGVSEGLTAAVPMIRQAWFAVDVFFVMSGFVMAYVYGSQFSEGIKLSQYANFFYARFARLYPVHLFSFAVIAAGTLPFVIDSPAFLSAEGRYSWQSGLATMLMLHSPWIDHRTWNFPAWSISAEWHAYAVFPFIVPVVQAAGKHLALAAMLLGVAVPFYLYMQTTGPEPEPTNTPLVLLRVLPLFLSGMILYRLNESLGPIFSRPLTSGLTVVALLFLLNWHGAEHFAVLLIPALVLCVLNAAWLRSIFTTPTLLFLGAISYSLYMTHAAVAIFGLGIWLRRLATLLSVDPLSSSLANWAVFTGSVVAAILLGWLTMRWIEIPSRKTIFAWLTQRRLPG
jgi:peptidoglycan/LPS O-acetylase OafA/YrhL